MTVGLDMEVSGNGARSAADIDQCASVAVGQPATVDIAVPPPGVPPSRGVSAYQFTLFYDSKLLSVTGDDSGMLLDAAAGSALIPFADGKPDSDGIYTSAAVDFGPRGIEPGGASETGPGVLARLTLTPKAAGVSGLVIKDVSIKDDSGDDIEIISILSAHLYAGEPCPGQAAPTPTASPATQASATPVGTRSAGGPQGTPAALVRSGGPPVEASGTAVPLVALGALAIVFGAAALAAASTRGQRL